MCYEAVSNDPFMLKHCLDRYQTQKVFDKTVDEFVPVLKFVPDWFVTSNIIKKLHDALFANQYTIFINEDSINVTFRADEMDIVSVDLDKINIDDVNFDEDDPETIIHVRVMAWHNRFKQRKAFKKDISK